MDNRERARARDKKHRRQMSLEFNSGGEKMRNVRGQRGENERQYVKKKANRNTISKFFL